MKICFFQKGEMMSYGFIENNHVYPFKSSEQKEIQKDKEGYLLNEVILRQPSFPSKVIAVGLNYSDHAKELNMEIPDEPIIFMKPSTSVIGTEDNIIYPKMSKQVDYEAELGVVISKKVKNVSEEDVGNCILGYTCANDITARDLQRKDGQWTRAKSFDTFSPFGPWIVTDVNPDNLKVELYHNGEVKQSSSTSNMIFSVKKLVSFISKIMTLYPGDLIMTGTPPGVGPMHPGDEVEVRIEGIGNLKNKVVGENDG
ncbi:MAG: fumarylacetoacetate hydrolase family protein [Actinomycetia bacterium]|nr:fumarylacetoacetate hydrolase family protein [Actinomycetes bacterium]